MEKAMQLTNPERPIKIRHLVSFGLGDLYSGGSFLIIGMLFMFYLTEVVGLSPGLAGMVFAVGKIWDAISDPLMGYISDRTQTKYGRRRIYFLAGTVPVAISFAVMWIQVGFSSQTALFSFYSTAYIFYCTIYTMVGIPHAALNAEMSSDYNARTRLTGARMVFGGIGSLFAGVLPKIIVDMYPADPGKGYLIMAAAFGIFFALPWIVVYLGTWELPYERAEKHESVVQIFRQFGTIFKNRSFRVHMGMFIFAYSATDITMALFVYVMTYYLVHPEWFPIAMGTLVVIQIAMLPVYVFVANKKGKGFAYRLGLTIMGIGMLCALTLNAGSSVIALVVVSAVIGIGNSAAGMIPFAVLPDVIDVDELMTGDKRAGVYSGGMTLFRKLIQGAFVMPLIGYTLEFIGFVPKQQQSLETLASLKWFFVIGPVFMLLMGILVSFRYKITPDTHKTLKDEISRLESGGAKNEVDPQTKETCELLTGSDYEKLYGG
ncbi:MAG: MFS transporter [Proteobacteria bacterium]|nr:MFS transporter [Pseudomonadota bacterium]